ncbi:MAG: hypothetical protein HC828_07750 [Blastochloris sp.]|nr:hypothetical protein [Blastochloris sp.]
MPQLEQSIEIQAPPRVVFQFIANYPERMPEWWSAFELQERVTPAPTKLGSVSRYVYNMMGVKIKGEHEVVVYQPDSALTVKTSSGVDSQFDFAFTSVPTGTRLTVRVRYTLPGSVLGQLLNRLTIEQRNERDLAEGLHNLKRLVEEQSARVAAHAIRPASAVHKTDATVRRSHGHRCSSPHPGRQPVVRGHPQAAGLRGLSAQNRPFR